MNRKLYQSLTWLLWLALPLTALRFWMVWDQLPARMATHFNANWQPNGWMSKEVALAFALGMTLFILVIFTAILYLMQKQESARAIAWPFLAFSYCTVGFIFFVNSKVVAYNLGQGSADVGPWIFLVPVAVIGFTVVYLLASRRDPLPSSVVLADEVHGSALWGLVLMVSAAAGMVSMLRAPLAAFRLGIGLVFVFLLACGFAAWSGFHYVFTRNGLEIRALGFRLRSVPVEQIHQYGVGSWNFLRGYGIRGVGNRRAYVWGNRGVQLATAQGEIFLGHDDPDRIVRDLDMIRHHLRGQEASRT